MDEGGMSSKLGGRGRGEELLQVRRRAAARSLRQKLLAAALLLFLFLPTCYQSLLHPLPQHNNLPSEEAGRILRKLRSYITPNQQQGKSTLLTKSTILYTALLQWTSIWIYKLNYASNPFHLRKNTELVAFTCTFPRSLHDRLHEFPDPPSYIEIPHKHCFTNYYRSRD